MTIFRIILPNTNPKTGGVVYIDWENDHTSIENLVAQLNDGKLISGTQIVTHWGVGQNVRIIRGRLPHAISLAGVARIEVPPNEYVDHAGKSIHYPLEQLAPERALPDSAAS